MTRFLRNLATNTTEAVRKGVNRREVIVTGVAASGALLVGCSLADAVSVGSPIKVGEFGPFVKVDADGSITVVNKHIEMGQGSHTGLAAMVAEEMDADWNRVKIEQAPANTKLYQNLLMGAQGTGGSTAIANSWTQFRKAGAAARAMFVQAAANLWQVNASEIVVKDSIVSHPGSGKSAEFGDLLADAAKVTPPENVVLKDPKAFTLIGSDRVRRKDAVAKTNGAAKFTIDVQEEGLLVAMVAHSPLFGGKLKSFDDAAARKVPGVVDVFKIPTGVAVVANTTWAAKQGRDAITAQWDDEKSEKRSSDALLADYRKFAAGQGPADLKWEAFDSKGDPKSVTDGEVFEATYDFPFLSHAPMEPMDCVARVKGNSVKLSFGCQFPTLDQLNTAKIVGNLPGAIEIETLYAGGSFGRRANFQSDFVTECVHIAKKVGKGTPVKLIWTREDDMRAGYFRPLTHHAVKIRLDKDGYPAVWTHRIVSQSLMKGSPMAPKGIDTTVVEGTMGSPYLKATPIVDAAAHMPDVGVPVLWWRSVGATHTAYVMEHTIDQLARKAGKDPIEYRRTLYTKAGAKRHLAVLDLAIEKAGPTAAEGYTRGVAVHESFGTVVAQIAEVKIAPGGVEPKVGRVVTAVDCGIAIARDQIAGQMEGGTCYGLSAALYGEVNLKDGAVQETNFDTYRVLRMNEAPSVETHILPSGNAPSGAGEPGTPVIGPAVANALLAMGRPATFSQPFVKPVKA
ncbi:xanthine dehydrogenase family protein molybdopterin-binding subunit [Caulobacter sp. NIBR1757]|uniref:xanthine dehydrogenase family protein molybdopterin-binding subunit n=1 Tax=Caulobacter sp. NIBR1757 TaxID=3016000 RepID=UPI0022F0E7AA|nr:xanthine dehydrogenase family protein molybdopterin-binding subunit [Caulobacter sp. NIBR1757]WGM37217.1 Isoquinoline 1-oxidoreductase subunit beta [Caulobacter sp. NIBR1757]